jgi:predicted acyl esterase
MWLQRLQASGLWLDTWMRHQRRDEYWQHGSVCEDFGRITARVLAVSGWADGYSNAVFRLVENLAGRCWGLIGPWSHLYPHQGEPGPAIGFLQHAVKWWDRWLKGIENGIDAEPPIRVWMQDSAPPKTAYEHRSGRWVGEPAWPSANIQTWRYGFGGAGLVALDSEAHEPVNGQEVGEMALRVRSPLTVGLYGGKWCSYAAAPDLPYDQRLEDGGSLVFDSSPLDRRVELLGAPIVHLSLSVDQPVAQVAVRLSGVAPDDKATRITYGLLNLTHRESHEHPEPLEVGKRYTVQVRLNDVAQAIPAGHRLRVAISTSYWPLAWPPPLPVRLTVHTAGCGLELPIRPPRPEPDESLIPFGPPEAAVPTPHEQLRPKNANWRVVHDLSSYRSTLEVVKDDGTVYLEEPDLEVTRQAWESYSFYHEQFDTVRGEVKTVRRFVRGGWRIETVTRTVLTSDERAFRIRADLDAYEGDHRVFSKSWDRTIPRDGV